MNRDNSVNPRTSNKERGTSNGFSPVPWAPPHPGPLLHFAEEREKNSSSSGRNDDVVFLSFAQEQVFAEEQIVGGNGPLEIRFAHIVDVYSAAFDVFARLAFGRAEAAVHEQFNQRQPCAFEFYLFHFLRRNLTDDIVERGFGDSFQFAAE